MSPEMTFKQMTIYYCTSFFSVLARMSWIDETKQIHQSKIVYGSYKKKTFIILALTLFRNKPIRYNKS